MVTRRGSSAGRCGAADWGSRAPPGRRYDPTARDRRCPKDRRGTALPTQTAVLTLLVLLALPAATAEEPTAAPPTGIQPATALPVVVADDEWRSLYDSLDPALERRLARGLAADPERARLLRRKKLAVGVVDLSDPARPRFARVNGNVMMYAASLPKIAILLAAYQAFEDGSLEETPARHETLGRMIRVSSNSAATEMIDLLGFERIAATLTDPRYELYDRERGGGLWVGKRYAKQGRRYPDPLTGLSHGATATQVCRFYYLLATGRVIGPERSRQILGDLADPGLNHKFVRAVEQRAPRARLFRKSGTWKIWHSDSILVWGERWRRYILVAMVESEQGDRVIGQLVPVVEEALRPGGAAAAPAE